MAIVISAGIFGWAHIDDHLSGVELVADPGALARVFAVNTSFGIALGVLYWRHGLECAMLTHVLIDAVGLGIVMPAYLSNNGLVQGAVGIGLAAAGISPWRLLALSTAPAGASTQRDNGLR